MSGYRVTITPYPGEGDPRVYDRTMIEAALGLVEEYAVDLEGGVIRSITLEETPGG